VRLVLAIRSEPPLWEATAGKWGWRIALNFCFFLFKQKENEKIKLRYVIFLQSKELSSK
jgi:hypothetical protein